MTMGPGRTGPDCGWARALLLAAMPLCGDRARLLEGTSCAKASTRAYAPTRRRFNRAVFARIDVLDGKITEVGSHPPFDLLFSSREFEYGDVVGREGFEPP
jgi:hypothetical protein